MVRAMGAGRLRPLYAAVFLQSFALWVAIEKLFMTSIGFDAAAIGVMAALYAAVVPMLEAPSGILADRWSRRGVLAIATVALVVSVTIGGLSQNVSTYLVSALFLGVFFAMQSGTVDSIVYDTLVEETGNADRFERTIGRTRLVESAALVAGALTGGVVAELLPLRATYFLTVPFAAAAGVALLVFREPRLHEAGDREPIRRQVATTYRTILARGRLRSVATLVVLTSLLLQAMLEFGPLWLVALAVPALFYGPHWAGLTSALGLGGLLGSVRALTRLWVLVLVGISMLVCCVILITSHAAVAVVVAQVVLTLLVVAVSIPVMRRLHDAVPSTIRAGVASGVGALTWLVFIPFALLFGVVSNRSGVHTAGWILIGFAGLTVALMIVELRGVRVAPATQAPTPVEVASAAMPVPVPAGAAAFPPERFLPADHPEWPGHWSVPPRAWEPLGIRVDGHRALAEARAAILELPAQLRRVIVLRDVEGLSAAEVRSALDLQAEEERAMLNQARMHVRARLERNLEGADT